MAARLGHHCRGVVTAHVIESSKLPVSTTHSDNRLASNRKGEEVPGFLDLIGSPFEGLPRSVAIGRRQISSVLAYVWRLRSYRVTWTQAR